MEWLRAYNAEIGKVNEQERNKEDALKYRRGGQTGMARTGRRNVTVFSDCMGLKKKGGVKGRVGTRMTSGEEGATFGRGKQWLI